MNWCRLWHELPNDPKFRTIARVSQQPTASVIAVYIHLLVQGSANASERGRTHPNAEDLASALDLQTEQVLSILGAMSGRVIDENFTLTGWEKRQPKREDGSDERARKWRKQKKLEEEKQKIETPEANASERKRTQANAPEKIRLEENITNTEVLPVLEDSLKQHTHKENPPRARASDLDGQTSSRFDEFWQKYPRKTKKDFACSQFVSLVTVENEGKVFACLSRYLNSDEVSRGVVANAHNWLEQNHRDGWDSDWPIAGANGNGNGHKPPPVDQGSKYKPLPTYKPGEDS